MKGATAHAVQLNIFYKAGLADLYCTFMLHDGTTARALNEAFCGCSGELYGRDKDRDMVSGNQSTSEVRTKGRCDHRWKQGAGVRTTSCICQGTCNAGNVGSKRQRPQHMALFYCMQLCYGERVSEGWRCACALRAQRATSGGRCRCSASRMARKRGTPASCAVLRARLFRFKCSKGTRVIYTSVVCTIRKFKAGPSSWHA